MFRPTMYSRKAEAKQTSRADPYHNSCSSFDAQRSLAFTPIVKSSQSISNSKILIHDMYDLVEIERPETWAIFFPIPAGRQQDSTY